MDRPRAHRLFLALALAAASCMLAGDGLKDRARAALLECTGDNALGDRCIEIAGSEEAATGTRDIAAAFGTACGDIREVHVDDWASIQQIHDSDDGWSWRPGCAAGRVMTARCHGHFRFEVGLVRAGPAIGPVDVLTLLSLDEVPVTGPEHRHKCPRNADGLPKTYRNLPVESH